MLIKWLIYLAALIGCLFFLFFYNGWAAWITLIIVALLPGLSLVLSLPAMLTARIRCTGPHSVTMGEDLRLQAGVRTPLPLPKHKLRIRVENLLTAERLFPGKDLKCPTEHCGALECTFTRARIHDYLGMFCLPLRKPDPLRILIMPDPVEPALIPDTAQLTGNAWRPKPGGGVTENNELRTYQPGDNLRQIHWKLSAKTDDLILREPMVPVEFNLLLWFCHCGTPELLDRKLGNLLWLSEYLSSHQLAHDIMAFTDEGSHVWHIGQPEDLVKAVEEILCIRPSSPRHPVIPPQSYHWQYQIGGDTREE